MPILCIVRHGQSAWNLANRFTGEVDVDLTPLGEQEAREAGIKLRDIPFSHAFTSALKRAQETLAIILGVDHRTAVPVISDKALNERNYGDLQGQDKGAVAKQYGDDQVAIWRRSYAVRPPGGESLEDTAARVVPYFENRIKPFLMQGENVLIVAHGNSLRALMMHLEELDEEGIADVDLPTGKPRCYYYDASLKLKKVAYL